MGEAGHRGYLRSDVSTGGITVRSVSTLSHRPGEQRLSLSNPQHLDLRS
jgi:hypothetical protein